MFLNQERPERDTIERKKIFAWKGKILGKIEKHFLRIPLQKLHNYILSIFYKEKLEFFSGGGGGRRHPLRMTFFLREKIDKNNMNY